MAPTPDRRAPRAWPPVDVAGRAGASARRRSAGSIDETQWPAAYGDRTRHESGAAIHLPSQRGSDATDVPHHAPLSVLAVVNALWAALWSLLPIIATVAAVTLAGPQRPSIVALIRYAMAAWLVGHGVPIRVADEPLALIPLAIALLAAWRCVRAGRNTVRALGARRADSVRPAIVVAISVAIPYGLFGYAAAVLARGPGLDVSTNRAGLTFGGFAMVAAFLGAWPASGFARRVRNRLPYALRHGVRTALVGVMLLLAAGAMAVGVEIAVAGATATTMLRDMHLDFAGDAGIVVVCLAYAPNLAVWASAYLTGPGFTLTQVLNLPVFAGLPERPVTGAGQALLATPLLAGLVAGVLLARRTRFGEPVRDRDGRTSRDRDGQGRRDATAPVGRGSLAIAAVVSAPVAGLVLGLAGYLAAGALGSDALASIGQVGWDYAIIGGLGIGLGAAAGAQIAAGDRRF
ncbi:MAG TPA: DUF6350 family protein [Micromonosporaceae bacterium]|jgi:hypothetical protein|nr:DUF6350 family protein [Micromonosporaceae bacterium]